MLLGVLFRVVLLVVVLGCIGFGWCFGDWLLGLCGCGVLI